MPIKLKFKIHEDYLEVEFIGKRDKVDELEESFKTWSQVFKKCEENGLDKVLAISNLDKRLSTSHAFVFSENVETIGGKANYKFAGIVYKEELFNQYGLLATFLNNFGHESKIFNNKKDGKKWLLSK